MNYNMKSIPKYKIIRNVNIICFVVSMYIVYFISRYNSFPLFIGSFSVMYTFAFRLAKWKKPGIEDTSMTYNCDKDFEKYHEESA